MVVHNEEYLIFFDAERSESRKMMERGKTTCLGSVDDNGFKVLKWDEVIGAILSLKLGCNNRIPTALQPNTYRSFGP